jgi:hypothetical protein
MSETTSNNQAEIEAHIEAVAVRWQEVQSGEAIDAKLSRMNEKVRALKTLHQKRLNAILKSPRSIHSKIEALWTALDELGAIIKPYSACKRGCSHCCHQSVLISHHEAELIGKRIGVKPKPFEGVRERDDIESGYHNPCPFLKEGACSIYAHRPTPCRQLYNLDRDALLCELIGPPSRVPYANLRDYDDVLLMMTSESKTIYERDKVRGINRPGRQTTLPIVGDIRDFFPRGK